MKEVSKDTIKNCFAKSGVVEHLASIDDNEDVDQELNNLFEELSEESIADKYSNFNHEVCTSFPWRRVSVATCIQKYGATDVIAIEVKSDDNNVQDNRNESDVSQISPREPLNLLFRLVHVDAMSVDDTNALLNISEKMESLIIQQKR